MLRPRTELWASLLNAKTTRHVLAWELEAAARAADDVLTNGDLEDWTGSTPDGWTKTETGGTVAEETSDTRDPQESGSAAKLSRTASAGELFIAQGTFTLEPGAWYAVEADLRGSVAAPKSGGSGPMARWRIHNTTAGEGIKDDAGGAVGWSETWGGDVRYAFATPASWGVTRFWFRPLPTYGVDDAYSLRLEVLAGTGDAYVGEYLIADNIRIRGPYQRRAHYYSSKAFSWGGQDYARLAVRSRAIREEINRVVPEAQATFANVGRELMALIEPLDLLTGGRGRIRVIPLDASDKPDPQSLVLFQGDIERPKKASDQRLELTMVGILAGWGHPVPGRPTSLFCPARFAEGPDCNYSQTTTTTNSNAGPASTGPITVASGTNLHDGEKIRVGKDGQEVEIVSGGGTGSITVDTAILWNSSDPVIYTRCSRWINAPHGCTARERLHEFLGIAGIENMARQDYRRRNWRHGVEPERV